MSLTTKFLEVLERVYNTCIKPSKHGTVAYKLMRFSLVNDMLPKQMSTLCMVDVWLAQKHNDNVICNTVTPTNCNTHTHTHTHCDV